MWPPGCTCFSFSFSIKPYNKLLVEQTTTKQYNKDKTMEPDGPGLLT